MHCALCPSTGFGADLPRSSPEAQGVPSAAVLAFVEAADRIDSMNSVPPINVRNGTAYSMSASGRCITCSIGAGRRDPPLTTRRAWWSRILPGC